MIKKYKSLKEKINYGVLPSLQSPHSESVGSFILTLFVKWRFACPFEALLNEFNFDFKRSTNIRFCNLVDISSSTSEIICNYIFSKIKFIYIATALP